MTTDPLPKASRTCFLLMTGFISNKKSLAEIQNAFKEKGYSTFISNFWGETPVPDFSILTIEHCMTSISVVITQLKEQYDCIVGIGISISGALLIEHAKTHTDLDYIVSIGTPFKLKNRKLISFGFIFYPLITWIGKIIQTFFHPDILPVLASYVIVDYFEHAFPQHLDRVHTPTLFIQGEKDSVSDGSILNDYVHLLSTQQKKIVWVPHADHVVNYNKNVIIGETLNFMNRANTPNQ